MLSRHQLRMASAVFLVAAFYSASAAQSSFQWIKNAVDYQSEGRRLDGHVVATYDNVFMVTQCARRCQLLRACASYNFRSALRKCEINSASHVTNPNDVIGDDDSLYYQRDAFTIDAVNPRSFSPFINNLTLVGYFIALCLSYSLQNKYPVVTSLCFR